MGVRAPRAGFIAPEIRDELPGLRLDWAVVAARPGPSDPSLVAHLGRLSDRHRGAAAVTLRTRPVPRAYRAFFRQIGLDPDVDRPPGERAAVAALLHGRHPPADRIADALLVALVETGVPVWALDAAVLDATGLGVRTTTAADAERLGPDRHVPAGTLAVADGVRVHSVLFADPAPASRVRRSTTAVALYAVSVPGVPSIHVDEALWMAADLLGGRG
jgi:DNA/RNA-binding domain of Phe-tRNA-synthetase-like protein